jgi:phosphoglycolate phosphatase
MARSIIFDLDGTLIDSAPDIHAAVNRVLVERDLLEIDLPTLKSFVGNGAMVLVERCIRHRDGDASPAELDDALGHFLEIYADEPAGRTVLYSGVREGIRQLATHGYRLGICTNKPEALTRTILRNLNLASVFEVIIGGDTLPTRKPDPTGLLQAIETLGSTPDNSIFVGDSEVDAATAAAAGVRFALFTCGYRRGPAEAMPSWIARDDFAGITLEIIAGNPLPSSDDGSVAI